LAVLATIQKKEGPRKVKRACVVGSRNTTAKTAKTHNYPLGYYYSLMKSLLLSWSGFGGCLLAETGL
jgi:hypothetical protein